MKFLISACVGFIGSNLFDHLMENNSQVVVIDNLRAGYLKNLDSVCQGIDFYEENMEEFNFDRLGIVDAVVHRPYRHFFLSQLH